MLAGSRARLWCTAPGGAERRRAGTTMGFSTVTTNDHHRIRERAKRRVARVHYRIPCGTVRDRLRQLLVHPPNQLDGPSVHALRLPVPGRLVMRHDVAIYAQVVERNPNGPQPPCLRSRTGGRPPVDT